jgi:transcription initiation factor TFIIA large subunit
MLVFIILGNQLHAVLTGPIIAATMALPQHIASSLLQQHVTAALQGQAASGASQVQQLAAVGAAVAQNATSNGNAMPGRQGFQQATGAVRQLDGLHDTSDEEDDEEEEEEDDDLDEDDENDDKDDEENEEENDGGPEEVCSVSRCCRNKDSQCMTDLEKFYALLFLQLCFI